LLVLLCPLAVAPPGKWGDLTTPVIDCPSGTYKETWARASSPSRGCIPCGLGLWLSDKNYRVPYMDIYGQLMRQELVRGSAESCCESCGAVLPPNTVLPTNSTVGPAAAGGWGVSRMPSLCCCCG
jgi:hypothetical protein